MALLSDTKKCSGKIVITEKPIGWGYRHQQVVILFFCFMVSYSIRSSMGISLVAMTNSKRIDNATDATNATVNGSADDSEFGDSGSVGLFNGVFYTESFPTFNWSKKTQDTVMSAFYWGYMVLQLPAGQLTHRYGTRYLLTGALIINGVFSFTMPWAVYHGGWILAAVSRMIQGFSQSCVLSSMHTALGKWAPLGERGRLAAFAYGGQSLGMVIGMPISGFLAASPLGWPAIFRFYGLLAGIAAAILWIFGADSPAQHGSISAYEKRYIEVALDQTGQDWKKHMKVPWKRLIRCKGMYAIIVAHIGCCWGLMTLYTQIPAFMDKVLKVDIESNGLLAALPFFVMWLTNLFFSWATDQIIVRRYLSVTHTRKLASTVGTVPTGLCLILLAYVKKDVYIVETILVIVCSLSIASNLGYLVNNIDIAPNFAGTMMSISNFVANGVGSLAPIVAGIFLTDVTDELLWRKVFFTTAGLYFISNLVYVVYGTSELADWNDPEKERKVVDEEHPMIKQTVARKLEKI